MRINPIVATAALLAALAGSSRAQPGPPSCNNPCSGDYVAYELGDKITIDMLVTVTTPFTSGTVNLTRSHRLLVPAGINGAQPANPTLHYFGVETDRGTYDTSTTPTRMFSTSLGNVTFKPGSLSFFYDPASKAVLPGSPGPAPTADPYLCFSARPGSKGPKPDLTTTDQFGTQHPSLMSVDYACVTASLNGTVPSEAWLVCFKQRTKDSLKPPQVAVNTQDLGNYPVLDVDPIDEVCVTAQVQ